jgi:hypothetical protein
MRHQLPTSTTVHIDPQVPRVLHGVWIPPDPHDIMVGSSHDGGISEDADLVLFDLKQVELELPFCHILEECRLRARSTVRFYMCAVLVDNLLQRVDVGGDQGINATLLDCRYGVCCGLRHGPPLVAVLGRFLAGCSVVHDKDDILDQLQHSVNPAAIKPRRYPLPTE